MRDNNEGRSRDAGSAHQQPEEAPTAAPASTAPGAREVDAADDTPTELKPVSADMHQFIGRQLRAVFDDVAKQPVPDRFLELMKQLDDKTGAG